MDGTAIPDELVRFLLASGLSVPHVEAILQLRSDRSHAWDAQRLSTRLYVRPAIAAKLLKDLGAIGVAAAGEDAPASYVYSPTTAELASLLDQLEDIYSRQLVAVTRLIHSIAERKAQDFAAAFLFREGS